jgi:hypothetical protein
VLAALRREWNSDAVGVGGGAVERSPCGWCCQRGNSVLVSGACISGAGSVRSVFSGGLVRLWLRHLDLLLRIGIGAGDRNLDSACVLVW